MPLNPSSLLTCNLYIFLFSLILCWLRRKGCYLHINLTFLIVSLLTIVLRLSVPIEFPFTKTLFTTRLFPLMHFLSSDYGFSIISFTPWRLFLWLWAVGAVVNGILFLWKCYRFSCFQKRINRFNDPILASVLERLSKSFICLDKYQFYRLPSGTSACCTGIFKHKIYLPDSTYAEEELYYVLRHELAHCRNHDLIIKVGVELLRILQWWNPLIYWLKKNTYQLFEIRADSCATQGFNEQQLLEYAQCLLKSARLSPIVLHQIQTSVHESDSSVLKIRCQLILHTNNANDSSLKYKWNIFFCIVVVLFWFLSFFILINSSSDTEPPYEEGYDIYLSGELFAIQTENGYELYANHEPLGITMESLPSSVPIPVYLNE